MAITKKPKAASFPASSSQVDIEALINKGGSIANKDVPNQRQSKITPVALRIPAEIIDRIDGVLKSRLVKIPRHTWILEAIVEKLERESGGG